MKQFKPMDKPRLLVIEDDPDVQKLLTTVASRRGVNVDHASDGEEAITLLERNR